jgi:hypothetical protein
MTKIVTHVPMLTVTSVLDEMLEMEYCEETVIIPGGFRYIDCGSDII